MTKQIEPRPGVEAAAPARNGIFSEVRYRVVTKGLRSYHETFDEAMTEYWVRRLCRRAG